MKNIGKSQSSYPLLFRILACLDDFCLFVWLFIDLEGTVERTGLFTITPAQGLERRSSQFSPKSIDFEWATAAHPHGAAEHILWRARGDSNLGGKGIGLRDIITEEEYFVEEVSVSNAAALLDIIVTKIVGIDGIFHISGAAIIL